MAHLSQKDGIYLIRFRYDAREFKKSLKTRDDGAARAALHSVELVLHRLMTGQAQLPHEVDPGDFILSGGTLREPRKRRPVVKAIVPSLELLTAEYLESLEYRAAESYRDSQATHLRHLKSQLGDKRHLPIARISAQDLLGYQQHRLRIRNGVTVCRERNTIRQFFQWAVEQGHLQESPAARLDPIKADVDQPAFHTIAEIEATIQRGGLSQEEQFNLWNCLYLSPLEIGQLLRTVSDRAADRVSFMLHAIAAYTGMRRGEILRLTWSDTDLERRLITARSLKQSRTKKETRRSIDLHPELLGELTAWRDQRRAGQFVVSDSASLAGLDNNRANRRFWQPLRGTAWCLHNRRHLFKVGFHTYRHSFASNLAAASVDQRIIDEWMGHQTEAMRKRYRHLFPSTRRQAIESFSLMRSANE